VRILYLLLAVLLVSFILFNIAGEVDYYDQKTTLSSWANEQIEEEFSTFKGGHFSREDINHTYNILQKDPSNSITRFQIIDGSIYSDFKSLSKSDSGVVEAYNTYLEFFKGLVSEGKIGTNVEFILSIGDDLNLADDFTPKVPLIVPVKKYEDPKGKYLILAPDYYIISEWPRLFGEILDANTKYPWDEKIERAFWRGSSTGGIYRRDNWQDFPRVKIVETSSEYPALLDAKFTLLSQRNKDVVDEISSLYPIAMAVSQSDHVKYKMQISVEGSVQTLSSELWRLLSNSVLLRQKTTNMKWFHSLFKDGEHFIDIEYDMSDLMEKIKWILSNDKKAQKIAENASNVVKSEFTPSHLELYWQALLAEYAKYQGFDLRIPTLDSAEKI